ncbi:hypothetical protein J4447_03220 [Candidatus Pacearchaeota archaeon]|nr:hypothetical protein [Candidatus Pacearchaeota archaeon]
MVWVVARGRWRGSTSKASRLRSLELYNSRRRYRDREGRKYFDCADGNAEGGCDSNDCGNNGRNGCRADCRKDIGKSNPMSDDVVEKRNEDMKKRIAGDVFYSLYCGITYPDSGRVKGMRENGWEILTTLSLEEELEEEFPPPKNRKWESREDEDRYFLKIDAVLSIKRGKLEEVDDEFSSEQIAVLQHKYASIAMKGVRSMVEEGKLKEVLGLIRKTHHGASIRTFFGEGYQKGRGLLPSIIATYDLVEYIFPKYRKMIGERIAQLKTEYDVLHSSSQQPPQFIFATAPATAFITTTIATSAEGSGVIYCGCF